MLIPESNTPVEKQEPIGAEGPETVAAGLVGEDVGDAPRDVPRPIGPERLRQLREAIENGSYPSDDDVAGGLEALFRRP